MKLQVCAKCSDMFAATLYDDNGDILQEYDGYVPAIMPGNHYGDYVMIDIDVNTGQILNWKRPTQEEIQEFIDRKSS